MTVRPQKNPTRRRSIWSAIVLVNFLLTIQLSRLSGADWPMWRADAGRGGYSPEQLPESLHLQWFLELPLPRPAWPSNQAKLQFDRLYEPVLLGKLLFVPSMIRDSLTAYETDTGKKRWTFYAEGPIRFAPVASNGKVYFGSDDGHLYCLRAEDGALEWQFRGGPSARRVLGNDRLINAWPARGAPVLYDNTIYFGASIWPFMGIFLHALDAETGRVVWSNTGSGSRFITQQHNSPAFAGVAPQGYFAATEEHLIIAGGKTLPAVFDRRTGEFKHFNVSSRRMGSKGGGGYEVTAGSNFYINRGKMYRMDNGQFVAPAEALIVTENAIIGNDRGALKGYRPRLEEVVKKDRKGGDEIELTLKTSWTTSIEAELDTIYIMSGTRVYGTGKRGEVIALELPRFDRGASVSWRYQLPGHPLNMIAGDGKLLVTTEHGRIYCFGEKPTDRALPTEDIVLLPKGAEWKYLDDGSDQSEKWRATDFDDGKWSSGKAPLGYGDPGVTELSFGPDETRKHLTYYFRHTFTVESPDLLVGPKLELRVDEGAVVYLNGSEVGRLNMPEGDVDATTLAIGEVSRDLAVEALQTIEVDRTRLRAGDNVLAVEVHLASSESADVILDAALTAAQLSVREVETPKPQAEASALVSAIVAETSVGEGYCVAFGIGTGRLIDALVAQTGLHVVVVDPDPKRVAALRQRLDRAGLYGTRVAAITASPVDVKLPPYMADLVVAEDLAGIGFGSSDGFVQRVFEVLRPFSGVACFEASDDLHTRFAAAAAAAELDQGVVERRGSLALLRRTGPPTGSGEWTHQHGDASNGIVSSESRVRLPLGLLWFGGPSNEAILPRHGHGPTPQVAGGRLVIEGRNMLRAVDSYTGRVLWERDLEDVGKFYDYTSHEPGANAVGSNYVTLADAVYVVYGRKCLRLDPSTGATVKELELPMVEGEKEPPEWGYLGVSEDILVAGAQPIDGRSPSFFASQFGEFRPERRDALLMLLRELTDFDITEKRKEESDLDHVVKNFNRLLYTNGMVEKIPVKRRKETSTDDLEARLARYLADVPGRRETDARALVIKRHILAKCYFVPDYGSVAGTMGSRLRMGSKRLVALDRHTGQVLWEREAEYQIRHNAVALGGGKAFFIDRIPKEKVDYYKRRGIKVDENTGTVAGFDIRNGNVLWTATGRVFGTWLGYSTKHDILFQGGAAYRDRSPDETGQGMVAYNATTGEVLWENNESYGGPCILLGDWVITQGDSTPGFALDIRTGKLRLSTHPISGEKTRWGYTRHYGCNTAVGCPTMLTFRSAAAGYYDLVGEGGTGNFGGFRSGCTSNLIPAGGVLNAPDYTRTCSCSYQNQSSLALVHMPGVERWTFSPHKFERGVVQRLGLNFGAPGDRRGPDGTYWLDYPSVGGSSPDVPIELSVADADYKRRHEAVIEAGSELPWVAASGFEGSGEFSIQLVLPTPLAVGNSIADGPSLEVKGGKLDLDDGGSVRAFTSGFDVRLKGHASLAVKSITFEAKVRLDADLEFVDARAGGTENQQGFVIDKRDVRVRYFVAKEDGQDNETEVTIQGDKRISDNEWARVAFTYDAPSGVGRLYVDGELVGEHEGRKGRSLWWDAKAPEYVLAKAFTPNCRLDDVRVSDVALEPKDFLSSESAAVDAKNIVGHWPLTLEDMKIDSPAEMYSIALVFAELDDVGPGERVFDVAVQGETVLENFDVVAEAGGPRRSVTKQVGAVEVNEDLRITLTTKSDRKPILNGLRVTQGRRF